MREVLRKIGPVLREVHFRGSGETYRKREGDFVFVVNFQGSQSGDGFYVNLGAQPTFIPAECDAPLKTLKEYECVLRQRVGDRWPWQLSDDGFAWLKAQVISAQQAFFGHASTLRAALATEAPDVLLREFSAGTSEARASLHLARAALALEHRDLAHALATRGIELAGDAAVGLAADLREVLQSASERA